jgi:hypothetical protein
MEQSMRVNRTTLVAYSLMMTFATACASTGTTGGPEVGVDAAGSGSRIVIQNAPGGSLVTAYIVPESGAPQPLGTIEPGRQAEFSFDGPPGIYRLRLVGGGGEQLSDTFRFFADSEARWNVGASGSVRVSGN